MTQETRNIVTEGQPKVAGRPQTPLDENLIIEFLKVGMPISRIADYFNCTRKTLYLRLGHLIHQHNVMFDYEILAKQKELADAGDGKMLIHIGKTRLKQNELPVMDIDSEDENGGPIWKIQVMDAKPPVELTADEEDELEKE